jgi:hypothetical protein
MGKGAPLPNSPELQIKTRLHFFFLIKFTKIATKARTLRAGRGRVRWDLADLTVGTSIAFRR